MTVGDNVIIKVGVSELQQLQASHGGWTVGMVEVCMLQLCRCTSWPLSLFSLLLCLSVSGLSVLL